MNTFSSQPEALYPPEFSNEFWQNVRNEAAENRIPIHGHFELTPQCNLDCKMCYVHLNKDQMHGKKELSLQHWIQIIDQAIDAGMIFASLSGGECLTYPFFDELYLYLKKRGILISVLTNGVLLEEKLPLFIEHPPAFIQVSIYGWDEDSYENVTGKRLHSKVNNAIKKAHNAKLPVSVAVTASRYLPSVYNVVRQYYEMNIGVAVNRWIMAPNDSTGRNRDEIKLSVEEMVEISKEILMATDKAVPPEFAGEIPAIKHSKSREPQAGIRCAAGRSDFSINWKGEMSLCVSLPDITGFPLIDGFAEAWTMTVKAADAFLMPVECDDCNYSSVCKHCPAYHLLSGKVGHCSPDACKECQLMVKSGLEKIANP